MSDCRNLTRLFFFSVAAQKFVEDFLPIFALTSEGSAGAGALMAFILSILSIFMASLAGAIALGTNVFRASDTDQGY